MGPPSALVAFCCTKVLAPQSLRFLLVKQEVELRILSIFFHLSWGIFDCYPWASPLSLQMSWWSAEKTLNDSFRVVTLCCVRCFTQLTVQRQVLTSQFTEDKAEASVVEEEPLAQGHTLKGVVEAGLNQRLWFKFGIFLFFQVPSNGSVAKLYCRFPFCQKCLTTFRESFGFSI